MSMSFLFLSSSSLLLLLLLLLFVRLPISSSCLVRFVRSVTGQPLTVLPDWVRSSRLVVALPPFQCLSYDNPVFQNDVFHDTHTHRVRPPTSSNVFQRLP